MLDEELGPAAPVCDGDDPEPICVAVGETESDEDAATGSLDVYDPLDPSEPSDPNPPEPLELFDPPDPIPVSPVPTLFVQKSLDASRTWGCCCCRRPAYASRVSSKSPELLLLM